MDKIYAVRHIHEVYDWEEDTAVIPDNDEYVAFFSTREKAEAFVLENADPHKEEHYGLRVGQLDIKEFLLDGLVPGETLWWKRNNVN